MLTSAVIGLPSGESIGAPSGQILEIEDAIGRSLIRGKIAAETDQQIPRDPQPVADDPTHTVIEKLIKQQPIKVKRPAAIKKAKKKPVKKQK